ncbi:MAG: SH3 domain-containing protein [Nocardioidaceae bacterium]|nr:MAG: SH3 domain-containing protein [Nocardioidaceae bacterium]
MSSAGRHRAARPALRTRVRRLAAPASTATAVTGAAVVIGISATGSGPLASAPASGAADLGRTIPSATPTVDAGARALSASRTAPRLTLEPEAVRKEWATADLNVWAKASDESRQFGEIESGTRVAVTGKVINGWAEILLKGEVRYVNAEYLAREKPESFATTAGISAAACPDGSSIERGLTAGAVRMYRAVCAAFPALSSYGGWDNHGEHTSGRAIDFMITDPALGKAVAEWLRAHAAELNLYNVIWAQQIYTQERGGEGWRWMSNRGSATANHYDHVHASVY